jgi:DNA replication protein DnaC
LAKSTENTAVSGEKAQPRKLTIERGRQLAASSDMMVAPCHLKMARPCCSGRGYQISVDQGVFARAAVCTCVKECPGCFGSGRRISGNQSEECRNPNPGAVANLINAANIPSRYGFAQIGEFENFTGNARNVIGEISRWKSRFKPVGGQGLIIEGPVGVGKTYILSALAKEFAEQGYSVRFTDFFQLLAELRAGYSEGRSDATMLAPLLEVDVLVIDELGKGRNNDFELTILDQLVCGRYNQNKTIIASTNYKLQGRSSAHSYNIDLDRHAGTGPTEFASDRFENLEQRIGPRIYSRLREMTAFMELTGNDYRRRKT